MSREIAHQKMFEAALDAIPQNFPPGRLPGDDRLAHHYYKDSADGGTHPGYDLAEKNGAFGFELIEDPVGGAPTEGAL